jgi:hypothetical protein
LNLSIEVRQTMSELNAIFKESEVAKSLGADLGGHLKFEVSGGWICPRRWVMIYAI